MTLVTDRLLSYDESSVLVHSKVWNAHLRNPLDSILLAVLTVSPNKQYLGIFTPTTPAQQGPEKDVFITWLNSGLALKVRRANKHL